MSDDGRPPLVSVASQLPPLAAEFGTAPRDSDMYTISCRCAVARGISVVARAIDDWDEPTVALLVPALRPVCEDLISLTFLARYEQDVRARIIRALARDSLRRDLSAQASFFADVRPWQPLLPELPNDLFDESIESLAKELKWPKRKGSPRWPSTYWMAEQVGLTQLYRYVYRVTSNAVHFNPQNLLRMAWGHDEEPLQVGVSQFAGFYREHLLVYGSYLTVQLLQRLEDPLCVSEEAREIAELVLFGLRIQPRWPEAVTFEEMNIPAPDHVKAWRAAMEVSTDPTIRAIWESTGPANVDDIHSEPDGSSGAN